MDKWLYRASVAFVVIGLLVSIYMTIYKITGYTGMCLGSNDCGTVVQSKYSEVNGMDVPVLGAIGFAAILAALFLETRYPFFKKNGTLAVFGMSLMGFLFVLWLVYVEIVYLKAYCPFCITTQITMTIVFILSVIRVIRQPQT